MPRMTLQEILDRAEELADRAEAFDPSEHEDTTTPEMSERREKWKKEH